MEVRQFPYESRPCDGWAATKELLDQTTLLLVAQVGPTVFNIRDQEGCCWRVTIGNPHRCTCYPEEPFCIHVLYVLLKVLQVPVTNPLAWQRSYTDADIDQVLAGRLRQMERRVATRQRARSASQRLDGRTGATKVTRHSIDDDKICPICQDEFEGAQDVSWCKTGCGNNMHLSCMITYTEYKIASKTAVTCPLCREDWGAKILHTLRDECRAGRPAVKLSAPCCVVCRTKIRSTFFRCLDCTKPELPFSSSEEKASRKAEKQQWTPTQPPVDTCATCYNRGRYGRACGQHHTFVTSDASSSCWEFKWEAIARPQQLTPRAVEELQTRELTADDYQRLLELCEQLSPPPLQNYLVQWLREGPELSDKCGMCSSDPPVVRSSRQLPCGDCVHHHCLLNAVTTHHATHPQSMDKLACPHCKNPMFSALTRRPVVRKVERKPDATSIGSDSDIPVRGVAFGPSRRLSTSDLHETESSVLSIRLKQSRLLKLSEDTRARASEQEELQIVGPRRGRNDERWRQRSTPVLSFRQRRVSLAPTPPRPRPRTSEPDLQLAGSQLQHSIRTQREA